MMKQIKRSVRTCGGCRSADTLHKQQLTHHLDHFIAIELQGLLELLMVLQQCLPREGLLFAVVFAQVLHLVVLSRSVDDLVNHLSHRRATFSFLLLAGGLLMKDRSSVPAAKEKFFLLLVWLRFLLSLPCSFSFLGVKLRSLKLFSIQLQQQLTMSSIVITAFTFMQAQQSISELTANVSSLTVKLYSPFDAPAIYSASPKVPQLYAQLECLANEISTNIYLAGLQHFVFMCNFTLNAWDCFDPLVTALNSKSPEITCHFVSSVKISQNSFIHRVINSSGEESQWS